MNVWENWHDLNCKCQLLALLVVGIIIIDFVKNQKLPLRSTKVFGGFLGVCFLNLIMDIVTYNTLLNYRTVDPELNRFVHYIFMISVELLAVTMFVYVSNLSGEQRSFSLKRMLLCQLPFLTGAVVSAFMPVYYVVNEHGAYSYGPMVSILYGAITLYIIGTFVLLARKPQEGLHADVAENLRKARITIFISLMVWVTIAIVQFFSKFILVSSLGNCFMALYIYLFFENPKKFSDEETGTLNRQAFHVMVPEMLSRKKTFWLVSLTIDDNERIKRSMGYDRMREIIRCAAGCIKKVLPKILVFRSRTNTLTMFVSDKEELDLLLKNSENFSFELENRSEPFVPKYHITVLECPRFASASDEVYDIMDYTLNRYHPKESGIVFFIDDDAIKSKKRYNDVLKVLTKAVSDKSFDVVYQPIYSTSEKRFVSAEALVRMQNCGKLGFISPEEFIPMAEEHGYVAEIGSIVFEKVCSFAAEHKLREAGIEYIEVNLSGLQVVDPMLPEQLSGIMRKYGIDPSFFNLEITESASIEGGDIMTANMALLREMGCQFSMDDFGTGYSNLSKMAQISYEIVKLDKSLIWPAFGENSGEPMIVLTNCINMLLQLGSHIVAEGVETVEQVDFLASMGVNYLQGYYFSKPVSDVDFLHKINAE